jgi:hypothetical protein
MLPVLSYWFLCNRTVWALLVLGRVCIQGTFWASEVFVCREQHWWRKSQENLGEARGKAQWAVASCPASVCGHGGGLCIRLHGLCFLGIGLVILGLQSASSLP